MKTNYTTPSIEIIEIEIEDAVLNLSDPTSLPGFEDDGNAW